jgi:hypothetical protein
VSPKSTIFALQHSGSDPKVTPAREAIPEVSAKVSYEPTTQQLRIRFEVVRPASGAYQVPWVNSSIPLEGSHHWGLWDWDVVEAFIDLGGGRYFEFVASPLGQRFELEIFEPRVRTNRDFTSDFQVRVSESEPTQKSNSPGQVQVVEFEIPLQACGASGDLNIRGGLFGIFGPKDHRVYLSAFLPFQETPDFHRPEYFRALLPG